MKIPNRILNLLPTKHIQQTLSDEEQKYAILIKDVSKQFKKQLILKKITIKVNSGEIHAFFGPNGAGKTTTIKSLISALKINSGNIYINGLSYTTKEAKKMIGYIPELARFPKRITAWKYLLSMAKISGLKPQEAKNKVEEMLKKYDLWDFCNQDPNSFSSGMKKKILLIQALLNDPKILILDEPAANLDPTARTELFNELKKLSELKKTIFISSHILSELQNFIDSFTILRKGEVVYSNKINDEETYIAILSSNNAKLRKLLVELNYQVEQKNKFLLLKKNNEKEVNLNQIQELAFKNNIIINSLKPYKIDLQEIYEQFVMEKNKNKGGWIKLIVII
ncbi:ABC transporter ATP-binding protein [Spiroplasma sp. AdecLV25b]|uniref:ABC transporter ATP-binding protein n=1 Tax=Spiroplasma sp. AdecLV25b TaxID=3027162 RepID=UPI0027DFE9A6|nr:ABC transporter ATP-binding protein [Spiroplasma sp. AdecLV25b]